MAQKPSGSKAQSPPSPFKPAKGNVRIYFNPFRYAKHVPLRIRWSGSFQGDESAIEILKPLNGDVVEVGPDGGRILKRKSDRGVVYLHEDGSVSLTHGQLPYRPALDGELSRRGLARFWGVRFPVEQDKTEETFRVVAEQPFGHPNPVQRETEMVKYHFRLPSGTPEAPPEETSEYGEIFRRALEPQKLISVDKGPGLMDFQEGKERYDLRHRLVYTIDGESTRDIDDAVEVVQLGKNRYLLGVHIADVTEFVKEGSRRDEDAKSRGTSHYLADTVIHMLPQCLSQYWCSLKEGEDRLAVSVYAELEATDDGFRILGVRFAKSVIRSHARLTYGQVDRLLHGEGLDRNVPLNESIRAAGELARVVESGSSYREITFASENVKYRSAPDGTVLRESLPRGDADALIEMFMITANRSVGEKLADMVQAAQANPRGIGVYRVQISPSEQDLQEYLQKLKDVGLANRHLDYDALRREAARALEADPDLEKSLSRDEQEAWVRSAVYRQIVQENRVRDLVDRARLNVIGRFGYKPGRILSRAGLSSNFARSFHHSLGINRYVWFTSPIRRYPDIVNHRQLKSVLEKGGVTPGSMDVQEIERLLNDAQYAENRLHNRLLLYHLCDHEGLRNCRTLEVLIASFQWLDRRRFTFEGLWQQQYPLTFSFPEKVYARIDDFGLSCRLGRHELRVGETITVDLADPARAVNPERGTILIDLKDIRKGRPERSGLQKGSGKTGKQKRRKA